MRTYRGYFRNRFECEHRDESAHGVREYEYREQRVDAAHIGSEGGKVFHEAIVVWNESTRSGTLPYR